jgi:hypothetical protein
VNPGDRRKERERDRKKKKEGDMHRTIEKNSMHRF